MAVDDDVIVKNSFGFQSVRVVVNDSVIREVILKAQKSKKYLSAECD